MRVTLKMFHHLFSIGISSKITLKITSKAIFVFLSVILLVSFCESLDISISTISNLSDFSASKVLKRDADFKCFGKEDCALTLPNSICLNGSCMCAQGYRHTTSKLGCIEVAKHLGDSCNVTVSCGEDLSCINNVCWCPEGQQYVQMQDANLCLQWRRPTRLIDRCRNVEDCFPLDLNSVCRKRWCHCKSGYQMFETMLFGLKHKCFRTYKRHCHNSNQCFIFGAEIDQHCICQYGYCHCIPNSNSSDSDIHKWVNEKPSWYHHWRKDIILATRLLFITVILFFVPCFVYVTLGVREHGSSYFTHPLQSRSSRIQAAQPVPRNRTGSVSSRPRALYIPETHNVEISLGTRGVSSRLVDTNNEMTPNTQADASIGNRTETGSTPTNSETNQKDEDPPPSYDDIIRVQQLQDTPPPPYREI